MISWRRIRRVYFWKFYCINLKILKSKLKDFQDDNCSKDLYVENAHKLLLWLHKEQIKFSWQEEFYTNSAAYDPYQVIKRLSKKEKSNKNPIFH